MKARQKQEMEYVDTLVFRFQNGDKDAGEELLEMFGGHPNKSMNLYIGKFYKLLRMGRFSFLDKDSRKFISCFIANPTVSQAVRQWFQYRDTKIEAAKMLTKVQDLCRPIDDEELKQDLRVLFFQQAKRFKRIRKNIGFTGYLYNSYRYAVIEYIQKRVRKYDPYLHMYNRNELISIQEDRYVDRDTEVKLSDVMFIDQPMIQDDDELGNSWIRGITCGEEFKKLTPLQRLIIKLSYEDDMTDIAISEKLNMHRNTIRKYRNTAIDIIAQTKEELIKEGYYE